MHISIFSFFVPRFVTLSVFILNLAGLETSKLESKKNSWIYIQENYFRFEFWTSIYPRVIYMYI